MLVRFKHVAIIALLSFALIAALEAILRLTVSLPPLAVAYQPHPHYLHQLKPGVESSFQRTAGMGGGKVIWKVNSQGFRGEEARLDVRPRIVIYGDSNVQAHFSKLEDTLASVLQRDLADALGTDLEVINAGVVGYGPDQVSLRLLDELEELRPDLVIVHVFADNDFGDLIRNKIYRLTNHDGLVLSRYALAGEIKRAFVVERFKTFYLYRVLSAVTDRYRRDAIDTYKRTMFTDTKAFLDWMIAQRYAEYESYKRSDLIEFAMFDDYYDYDLALQPNAESSQVKSALMRAVIGRIGETLKRYGKAKFLLLIQPSARDISENLAENHRVFARYYSDYRPSHMSDIIASAAEQYHIPYLNLFPTFKQAGAARLYFKDDDDHWNEAGQAFVAQRLTAEIIGRAWLAEFRAE